MAPQEVLAKAREIEKTDGRVAAVSFMSDWLNHELNQSWSYDDQDMRMMSAFNADIISGMIVDF